MDWKTPAWQSPVAAADSVELLSLPAQEIVPENDWPDGFWSHVNERQPMTGSEAAQVLHLFQSLAPSVPARCHMPPWGIAFYAQGTLLFTSTLCYRCSNAYVYTAEGKALRAFDPDETNATSLREILKHRLPLQE